MTNLPSQPKENSAENILLELQAAIKAVRLKEQIVKEHESNIQSYNFCTDSTTVLQWIHSSRRKQQLFVANRIAEVLDTTDVSQWNHVSGINNPARSHQNHQQPSGEEPSMLMNSREVNGSLRVPA